MKIMSFDESELELIRYCLLYTVENLRGNFDGLSGDEQEQSSDLAKRIDELITD